MKLYELEKTINDVIEMGFSVDEETGEILFDESNLEQLEGDINEKIDNIVCFIKNLDADEVAIKAEEKALADRRKGKANQKQHLMDYLQGFMERTGRDKFESARNKVGFRKSEQLVVADVYKVPEDYLRYKEPEVNKTELKKAIKNGLEVEGVTIETKMNMQIK